MAVRKDWGLKRPGSHTTAGSWNSETQDSSSLVEEADGVPEPRVQLRDHPGKRARRGPEQGVALLLLGRVLWGLLLLLQGGCMGSSATRPAHGIPQQGAQLLRVPEGGEDGLVHGDGLLLCCSADWT